MTKKQLTEQRFRNIYNFLVMYPYLAFSGKTKYIFKDGGATRLLIRAGYPKKMVMEALRILDDKYKNKQSLKFLENDSEVFEYLASNYLSVHDIKEAKIR